MNALRVVANEDEHFCGGARAHAVRLEQVGRELLGQLREMSVLIFDFCVEGEPAPGNGPQADLGGGRR